MKNQILIVWAMLISTVLGAQNPIQKDTLKANPDSIAAIDTTGWSEILKGTTVVAQRKLIKIGVDRISYDVQNDEQAKSANTLDMLRKVPMVTVDGQENVLVRGSSNYKIYRNGHQDPSLSGQNVSQVLKSMPASMIKSIEVITDPGAREDAEGTNYILNIVMKSNSGMSGVTGTLSAALDPFQGIHNESAYITAQKGKFTFSINYSYAYQPKKYREINIQTDNYFKSSGATQSTSIAQKSPVSMHFGEFSSSYEINPKNLLTFSFGGSLFGIKNEEYSSNLMTAGDGSTIYEYDAKSWNLKTPRYYNAHGRLDYQMQTSKPGESLTVSYMYSGNGNKSKRNNDFSNIKTASFDYTGYLNDSKMTTDEHTGQIDYIRPLGQKFTMEWGAKYINRWNKSRTNLEYENATTTSDVHSRFNHNTQVAAAYTEWMFNSGKWSAQAGVRYEYSYMRATYPDGSASSFHKRLNDWVPSASVRYSFAPTTTLKLGYSSSINRPGISYLNPARVETPSSLSYGNPDLNSAINHNFTLEFMHAGQKMMMTLSPFLNFSNDQISEVQFVQDEKTVSTYDDVLKNRRYGADGFIRYTPFAGTSVIVNAHVENNKMKNNNLGLELDGWSGTAMAFVQQNLPWKLILNVGGGGSFGRSLASVYGYGPNFYYYSASLQRSFLKEDRLTMSLGIVNPFNWDHNTITMKTVNGDYTGKTRIDFRIRQVGIRISYRFGNLRARVKHVNRSIENDDVVGGVQSGAGTQTGSTGTGGVGGGLGN
jgi:hypothetical protein